MTPKGSACSITVGKGLTTMKPETFDGLQMVVENSAKLRDEFVANGIEVSDVDTQEWGIFIYVKDPDGNQLIFQHLVPYNA